MPASLTPTGCEDGKKALCTPRSRAQAALTHQQLPVPARVPVSVDRVGGTALALHVALVTARKDLEAKSAF